MAPVLSVARLVGVLLLAPHSHADSLNDAPVQGAWSSERELLAHVRKSGTGLGDELAFLRLCVSRSWWTAAREVVALTHAKSGGSAAGSTSSTSSGSFAEQVKVLLRDVKRSADDFGAYADTTYRGQTKGLDEVHCAVQWAQNASTVFLGVKYATRWSAPGAIEVVDVKVNITSCCFELEGFGHHSSIRKRYVVDLPLFADLVPHQSTWSAASVGRLTATLHKAQLSKWPRLTKKKGRDATKHQIGTWLDMKERWEGSLNGLPSEKKEEKGKEKKEKKKKEKSEARKIQKRLRKMYKEVYSNVQQRLQHGKRQLQKWVKKPAKYATELAAVSGFVLCSAVLLIWFSLSVFQWLFQSPERRCEGLKMPEADQPGTAERAADSAEARMAANKAADGSEAADGPEPDPNENDRTKPHDEVKGPVAPDPNDDAS